MALDTTDPKVATLCEPEMAGIEASVLPQRVPLRVALNAIIESSPKFGSRVYLWELALALAKTDGVILTLLVGAGQTKELPPLLRSFAREVPVSARRSYLQIFQRKQIQQALRREQAVENNAGRHHDP
jgi:hypothetical protein